MASVEKRVRNGRTTYEARWRDDQGRQRKKSFGKKGDSWFTPDKGTKQSRKVSAKAGKTLYFFCAVHPFMQGKIKVEGDLAKLVAALQQVNPDAYAASEVQRRIKEITAH